MTGQGHRKEAKQVLRARWRREQELAEDAAARGWERVQERHACATRRVEQLLAELGEPLTEEPNDEIR